MMFECIDKVYPSVSIETVSGAICSFNDEYGGLPLKSCTSLISGYQEGSGTPSPSNPRNLVSFNSATLTENGNTYLFTFGQSIYQGSIDWKRGVVVGLWTIKKLSDYSWELISSGESPYFRTTVPDYKYRSSNLNVLAEIYQQATIGATGSDEGFIIISINQLRIRDLRYNDANAFVNGVGNVQLAYELATPIEIPLGGIQLLTQEGQNNIFCDIGDTTVEYIKIV